MIIDALSQAHWYLSVNDRIAQALRYLEKTDFATLAPGTYPIDARRIYAIVQDYETKPESEGRYESHHRYIDIQFVVSGRERIGWVCRDSLKRGEYDEGKDLEFHEATGTLFDVPAGTFVILAPHDAHMPCIHPADGPSRVRKVVVKVMVLDD